MSLKTRLIMPYTGLSFLLIVSLFLISNNLIEKQFNIYVQEKQEQKNLDLVQSVLAQFETGQTPSTSILHSLGQTALNKGLILMVNDANGNEIFCMRCYDTTNCENMLNDMENTMRKRYPNFKGEYTEKTYPLSKNNIDYGSVRIGFYGPFYYNEADLGFIEMLNKLFFIATLIFAVLAIGTGYLIAGRIVKPIKAVISNTQDIEKGNYKSRIPFSSKTTELDNLIHSINILAYSLENQHEMKKRMARDYAHEFRTPLAAIQLNLEGIVDGVLQPTTERIESIRQEILRLSRMVSDIDKITELQNNTQILKKEQFDIFKLLQNNLATFELEIKRKNIQVNLIGKHCKIYADKDKISSVIINLISNAVKYTDEGGKIDIILRKQNSNIIFTVSDTGIGISDTDLPYIFDHLYRADISRARNTGGSGIGLSVVKAIVDAHGGSIEVNSKMQKGTIFIVKIPEK